MFGIENFSGLVISLNHLESTAIRNLGMPDESRFLCAIAIRGFAFSYDLMFYHFFNFFFYFCVINIGITIRSSLVPFFFFLLLRPRPQPHLPKKRSRGAAVYYTARFARTDAI